MERLLQKPTQNRKQKQFLYSTTTNYGLPKTKCKFLTTRKCINGRWTDLYGSILDCWKDTREWPQCAAGINHGRRDVIVIDIDNSEDSISIPVSYKFQNPLSGHWQAGLVLNAPCLDKKTYIELTRELNRRCEGDLRFTGWQCKNPYHFDAEWTGLTFDFSDLYSQYVRPLPSASLSYMKIDGFEEDNNTASSPSPLSYMKTDSLKSEMANGEDSRHFHIMDKVNRFVWGNGARVSLEDTIEYMLSINAAIGETCNKEPEQEDAVIYQVKSLYPWAVEHYEEGKKPNHAPAVEDIEKWHEKALEARRRNRDYKIDKLRELIDDFGVQGSYRYLQKEMMEMFDIKVSKDWIRMHLPSILPLSYMKADAFEEQIDNDDETDSIEGNNDQPPPSPPLSYMKVDAIEPEIMIYRNWNLFMEAARRKRPAGFENAYGIIYNGLALKESG